MTHPRCETCKMYEETGYSNAKYCKNMAVQRSSLLAIIRIRGGAFMFDEYALCPPPDFGCIHHQPKEADDGQAG